MDLESSSRLMSLVRITVGAVMVAFGGVVIGYFSIWWALVRGIVRGVLLIQHHPIAQGPLAVDIVRIGSASVIGWGGTVFILVGAGLVLSRPRGRAPWEYTRRTSQQSAEPDQKGC